MDTIELPPRVIFESIMNKLQLPPPTFHSHGDVNGKTTVGVRFYQSRSTMPYPSCEVHLSSRASTTAEAAEHEAATKAIKYMLSVEKKQLKDYNYVKVKSMEESNKNLIKQLATKNGALCAKNRRIGELTTAFRTFIGTSTMHCQKIHTLAQHNQSNRQAAVDAPFSLCFMELEKLMSDFQCLIIKASEKLQSVGGYEDQSESDDSEADQFPPYLGPEDEYTGPSCLADEPYYDTDE